MGKKSRGTQGDSRGQESRGAMMGFFSNFFKGSKPPASFEDEKRIALAGDEEDRKNLVRHAKTSCEILCYMAAKDKSDDVRVLLAERLTKLLPELSHDTHSSLYKYVVEALGVLALDEVIKVRLALSTVLKDYADAPPKLAGQLARDVERAVSEPILLYCMALPDEDLLDIIRTHAHAWAVQAIARRPHVSAAVSGAVIDRRDAQATVFLAENAHAELTLKGLNDMMAQSRTNPQLQKSMAARKNLPPEIMTEMIKFVDQSVREILLDHSNFSVEDATHIAKNVERRVKFASEQQMGVGERVRDYLKQGRLNDESINDAISVRDYEFVEAAIAALLSTTIANMHKIFEMRAAKAVVAVCWKAGLSMRTALKIQQEIVRIPHRELIYPRGGTDYPLTDAELKWQLDFLGLGKGGS